MTGMLAALHPKRRFDSYDESERLEKQIRDLVRAEKVEEIPVVNPEHPFLEEHWYRDQETGEIYRYCPPEFPARGVWEKI